MSDENSNKPNRDEFGRFLPGNPGGATKRGKKYAQAYALARQYSPQALAALSAIACSQDAKKKDRIKAAKVLLKLAKAYSRDISNNKSV